MPRTIVARAAVVNLLRAAQERLGRELRKIEVLLGWSADRTRVSLATPLTGTRRSAN